MIFLNLVESRSCHRVRLVVSRLDHDHCTILAFRVLRVYLMNRDNDLIQRVIVLDVVGGIMGRMKLNLVDVDVLCRVQS